MPNENYADSGSLPESVKVRRRLAQMLVEKGADFSPIGHWTQGGARVMSSIAGNMQMNRLDAREKADNQAFGSLLARTLTGGAAPAAARAPPAPLTAPSTEPGGGWPLDKGGMDGPPAAPAALATGGEAPQGKGPMQALVAALAPGGGTANPAIASGPHKASPTPNDPFAFIRSHPSYVDQRQPGRPGAGALDPTAINDAILHDFGSRPDRPGGRSPYHIAVRPDGTINEAYGPSDRAPHAYRSNNSAWGIGYDGPVGSQPTPAALERLQFLAEGLRRERPTVRLRGHGEAYRDTRGTPLQASRDGRQLNEASWRSSLFPNAAAAPAPAPMAPEAAPADLTQRSMVAGHPNAPENVSRETIAPDQSALTGGAAAAWQQQSGAVPPGREAQIARAAEGLNGLLPSMPQSGADLPQTSVQPGPGQVVDQGEAVSNAPLPPGFNANSTAGPPAVPSSAPAGPAGAQPPQAPGSVDNAQIAALLQSGNPRAIAIGVQLWREQLAASRQPQFDFMAAGDNIVRTDKRRGTAEVVPGVNRNQGTIKEVGGKLVRVFPDGRTEVIYGNEGPDPSVTRNLQGGLDELGAIPQRYGGDRGVFSSAVGPVQGDLSNIWSNPLGPVARALGNLTAGGNISPAEVRRNIDGSAEALAASIKPLIRKPGEGQWSDADQARLNLIIGDLKQARDEASYRRELDNVRKRLNANFGLQLQMPPQPGARPGQTGNRGNIPPVGTQRVIGGQRYVRDDSSPSGWAKMD